MTGPNVDTIASLRLDLDFRPLQQGAEKSAAALKGVGTTAVQTQQTLTGLSAAQVQAGRITQQQVQVAGNFAQQLRAMGVQYSSTVTQAERFAIGQAKVVAAQQTAARSSDAMAGGLGKLRGPLQTLLFSLGGIPGPLGRVIGQFGLLAAGGAVSLGVAAGVALIGAAWERYSREAREAKRETDELVESLIRAKREASGELFVDQRTTLRQNIADAEARAARERQVRTIETGSGGTIRIGGFVSAAAQKELERANEAYTEFLKQRQLAHNKVVLDELAAEQRLADERKRLNDEEGERLARLAREREEATRAQLRDLRELEEFRRDTESRSRQLVAGRIEGLQARTDRRLDDSLAAGLREAERSLQAFHDAQAQASKDRLTEIRSLEQTRLAALALASATGALPPALTNMLNLWARMDAELRTLRETGGSAADRLRTLTQGIATMVATLATSLITGQSREASAARGAIGGAAAGAVVGGPVGAVVGGAAGLLGGLLGGSRAAEEEARRLRKAREDWQSQLAEFATAWRRTPLEAELARLKAEYRALAEAARELGVSTAQLLADYNKQVRATRERAAAEEAAYVAQLEIRRLIAAGDEDAAARLQDQLDRQAQLKELEARGYSEATAALLRHVQALEAETRAAERARQEREHRFTGAERAFNDELTLSLRETALRDPRRLAEAQATAERDRQLFAAQLQMQLDFFAGVPDYAARYSRLVAIITGEWNTAMAEVEAATARAIDDRAADRQFRDYQAYDRLNPGSTSAADFERERRQAAEIQAYIEAGAEAWEVAALRMTHANEEAADAFERNARAAEESARATEAAAAATRRLSDDLNIRYLEAVGLSEEADRERLRQRHAAEDQAAIDAGVSQAQRDRQDFIQSLEVDALNRRLADQATGLGGGSGSAAGVSRVIGGLTEQTGSTFVGYLASMNVYLSEISYNTSALRGGGPLPVPSTVGAIAPQTFTAVAPVGNVVNLSITLHEGATRDEFRTAAIEQIDKGLDVLWNRQNQAAGKPRVL